MRKILFQAKRKESDYWVVGYYDFYKVYENGKDKERHEISYIQDEYHIFHPVEIEPETVGQYTGFDDIENRQIFETDILKDNSGRMGDVVFQNGMWYVIGDINMTLYDLINTREVEVVGNVYAKTEPSASYLSSFTHQRNRNTSSDSRSFPK